MAITSRVSLTNGTVPQRRARMIEAGEPELMEHLAAIDKMSIDEWTGVFQGLVENVIGTFVMPLSIAPHFQVNGVHGFVPMVTEERSVVAAVSKAAKLARNGFRVRVGPSLSRGHAVFFRLPMPAEEAVAMIDDAMEEITADIRDRSHPFKRHGGGLVGLGAKAVRHPEQGEFLVLEVYVETGDAMGANGVTRLAGMAGELVGKRLGVDPTAAICINDNPSRTVEAVAVWHRSDGITDAQIDRVMQLQAWAEADRDRAVTHNKGIMNGVSAVCLATAQDVRAVEAGGAADAYRAGRCRPLTDYRRLKTGIGGTLKMQLSVGTVGGANAHPLAAWCRSLMAAEDAQRLMAVIGAVGLAQNFAALLCLGDEGIAEAHRRIGHTKHP